MNSFYKVSLLAMVTALASCGKKSNSNKAAAVNESYYTKKITIEPDFKSTNVNHKDYIIKVFGKVTDACEVENAFFNLDFERKKINHPGGFSIKDVPNCDAIINKVELVASDTLKYSADNLNLVLNSSKEMANIKQELKSNNPDFSAINFNMTRNDNKFTISFVDPKLPVDKVETKPAEKLEDASIKPAVIKTEGVAEINYAPKAQLNSANEYVYSGGIIINKDSKNSKANVKYAIVSVKSDKATEILNKVTNFEELEGDFINIDFNYIVNKLNLPIVADTTEPKNKTLEEKLADIRFILVSTNENKEETKTVYKVNQDGTFKTLTD